MTSRIVLTCCCLTIAAIALYFAPDPFVSDLRGKITDGLRPAQRGIQFLRESLTGKSRETSDASSSTDGDLVEQLKNELEQERQQNRALQIRMAQLHEKDVSEEGISTRLDRSRRLLIPSLVEAAVLGDTISEQWRAGKLLDQGTNKGLRENELVISSRKPVRPLIDLGEDADISPEDNLLMGRCVIGKVEHVGRWTSTIQLVTDSRYRGRAQLIRETEKGFVFESQGILKGQGERLCKLDGIPAEKSVRVNDAVYTAERDGILPVPLYYGRVVQATLGTDDREWTVLVEPAELPTQLTRVEVLRTIINPDRLAVK